jgi:CheY-like chemotaxis protein
MDAEALEAIQRLETLIVFLDVKPKMNGFEMLEQLRKLIFISYLLRVMMHTP